MKNIIIIAAFALLCFFLVKQCNNAKDLNNKIDINKKLAQFYLDEFNNAKPRIETKIKVIEKMKLKYLPMWKTRDTTLNNDAICDSIIPIVYEQDTVIKEQIVQIKNIVTAFDYKQKELDETILLVKKERRVKNFYKIATVGLSGLIIYKAVK